ncbi:IS1096 element passenger TnpR family protein [Clostridium sp. DL1XJH146]
MGYEEFLQIIEDKTQPDYERMQIWAKSQGFKEFDIDEINRKLKSS